MTRITFDEVSLRSRYTFRCSKCGRRVVRSRKFWQTLNPFNIHKVGPLKGQVKDGSAIYAELHRAIDEWHRSDVTCAKCEPHV